MAGTRLHSEICLIPALYQRGNTGVRPLHRIDEANSNFRVKSSQIEHFRGNSILCGLIPVRSYGCVTDHSGNKTPVAQNSPFPVLESSPRTIISPGTSEPLAQPNRNNNELKPSGYLNT